MSDRKIYTAIVKRAKSVTGALEQMQLSAAHIRIREKEPAYARAFEEVIESNLKKEAGGANSSTLERDLRDLERQYVEPLLPFPEEQIPSRPIEEKIALLEARWPDGLWQDEKTGELITVSMALKSPEMRKRALGLFHERAAKLKNAAKEANWQQSVFVNLVACFEKAPPVTNDDVDAFYGSGAWASARAVTLDRDGPFCAECGDYSGPFEVDHKISVKECWHLRLVQSNLQVLCVPDHNKKHRR